MNTIYPRIEYEMTETDLNAILDAGKPTTCIMIGSYTGSTPQENVNRAWEKLGEKMGFDSMTVQPIEGKSNRFFTAVPTETESQRKERELREAEEAKRQEVTRIEAEINVLQSRLSELLS